MDKQPCSVCGGSDMNLEHGYYYCVECGTQNENLQQTIVDAVQLNDGTVSIFQRTKIKTVKNRVEMSSEWHKWHSFNFALSSLVDQLIACGARPSVKMKALWVWSKYMKEFQCKDEVGKSQLFIDDESEEDSILEEDIDNGESFCENKNERRIACVTRTLLIVIMYIALNLDRSDIQLYNLQHFIKERRISVLDCEKFVPEEIYQKNARYWKSFVGVETKNPTIKTLASFCFERFNLGSPIVPDMRKIINNLTIELCLPNEFKDLVYSLMNLVTMKWRHGSFIQSNFELTAMSYIVVALKMCFGLDGEYEVKLSDAVDEINTQENRLKSFRISGYSTQTDRLFSFTEWCNYLRLRKTMLCKYNYCIAGILHQDCDDYVLMEQLPERPRRDLKLWDEITMDILNRIPLDNTVGVIPITEFEPSLTPMYSYTAVIQEHIQDIEIKQLLGEDFSQYSLKYACKHIKLPNKQNTYGVKKSNTVRINPNCTDTFFFNKLDTSVVYVRNCQNKNWMKTKPPTSNHVVKNENEISNSTSKDYDADPESTIGNKMDETRFNHDRKLEAIAEEDADVSIFDDAFADVIKNEDEKECDINTAEDIEPHMEEDNAWPQEAEDYLESKSNADSSASAQFNPNTFNREQVIKELILAACKKYKIPKPREYRDPRVPQVRRPTVLHDEAGEPIPKRRKTEPQKKPGDLRNEIEQIKAMYYNHIQNDTLNNVAEQVKLAIENFNPTEDLHESLNNDFRDYEYSRISSIHGDENESQLDIGEQNENNDTQENVDSDVIEISSDEEDNFISKSDPKYDEKTHKIEQLYVKFNDFDVDDIMNIDDPKINELLDKKIEECESKDVITVCAKDLRESTEKLKNKKVKKCIESQQDELIENIKEQEEEKQEPLVDRNVNKFGYWMRQYSSNQCRIADALEKFDIELSNFPSSFVFVLKECSSIIGCSCFRLYKEVNNLEDMMCKTIDINTQQ